MSINRQIKGRKMNWIGYILRTDSDNIAKQALDRKLKRGRPKQTWQRTVADEVKQPYAMANCYRRPLSRLGDIGP